MSIAHRWNYESDGEQRMRTHYVWRYNNSVSMGIERKNFDSRAEALKFIKEQQRENLNLRTLEAMYVIVNKNTGKMVALPGLKRSYTSALHRARKWTSKKSAQDNCCGNEYVREVKCS